MFLKIGKIPFVSIGIDSNNYAGSSTAVRYSSTSITCFIVYRMTPAGSFRLHEPHHGTNGGDCGLILSLQFVFRGNGTCLFFFERETTARPPTFHRFTRYSQYNHFSFHLTYITDVAFSYTYRQIYICDAWLRYRCVLCTCRRVQRAV